MSVELYSHQLKALDKLDTGKILCGSVGSGKSLTAIAYYYILNGGSMSSLEGDDTLQPMNNKPQDLYIITTAKKRDSLEWEQDLIKLLISKYEEAKLYNHEVVVDSWNNIKKYTNIEGAFFIFDEQRVVGYGAWTKAFLKITLKNNWILLSATPGDTWTDYIPVFIANGFYKNKTDFNNQHVIFKPYVSYPIVERYINVRRLQRLRDKVLIDMDYHNKIKKHDEVILCEYDKPSYQIVMKNRWDPIKDEPIETASSLCYSLRRIINSDPDRLSKTLEILNEHNRAIIFYNFDYELESLLNLFDGTDYIVGEWNGHKHQDVPLGEKWVYLVQYTAGAEGWNCIRTDTIIFFSQTYSYKTLTQAKGRIDRMNTPFTELYYYHLRSKAPIDKAIYAALKKKKKFNERSFVK